MYDSMSGSMMWASGPLVALVFAALVVLPFWFIFKKAGHSPWLSLLMLLPIVNIAMLYFLAFAEWPRLRRPGLRD
jgi:hypothetical protein